MNEFIRVDPEICSGKPTIRGTRPRIMVKIYLAIMVKNILGMGAGGYAVDQIVEAYPELTQEMVQAALEYAAAFIDEEHSDRTCMSCGWRSYSIRMCHWS